MGTILVVDDDPIITNLVSHVLTSSGHRVIATTDSEKALELARGQDVDVAVLDVVMPGTDGFQLVHTLRLDPDLAGVAVLMLSARNATRDRVHGLKTGADDYLGKPFDVDELVLRVERLIERSPRTRPTRTAAASVIGPGATFGRYEIREVLGRGAMGNVFKAWDPVLRRWVALKTLKLDRDQFPTLDYDPITALLQEASLAAQINHRHVVTVYDADTADNGSFIAMEFIDGPCLESLIRQKGRLAPGLAVTVASAVAQGLAAAHDHRLIHRDVKLSNILLGIDGAIKLSDFGLAGAAASMARNAGLAFGTPGYISPEALRGQPVDERADLFSLGVVLYSCLTGEAAFAGSTIPKVVRATLKVRPMPPARLMAEVDGDLSDLTMRLLEVDPRDRFQSAAEVVEALARHWSEPWSPLILDGVSRGQESSTSVSMEVVTD